MTIRGSYPNGGTHTVSLQNAHAIDVRGTSVEVTNVTASDMAGDCVYLGLGYSSALTRSTGSVHDMTCSRIGRNAVSVTAGDDIRRSQNRPDRLRRVRHRAQQGRRLRLEPCRGDEQHDRVVLPVRLGRHRQRSRRRPVVYKQHDHRLEGSPACGPDYNGYRPKRLTVSGNVASSATGSGAMEMEGLDGLTITGNTVPLTNGTMATVSGSCTVGVSGNSYPGGSSEVSITNTPSTCTSTPPPTPAPAVASFSPASGPTGTVVTVTGTASAGQQGHVQRRLGQLQRRFRHEDHRHRPEHRDHRQDRSRHPR